MAYVVGIAAAAAVIFAAPSLLRPVASTGVPDSVDKEVEDAISDRNKKKGLEHKRKLPTGSEPVKSLAIQALKHHEPRRHHPKRGRTIPSHVPVNYNSFRPGIKIPLNTPGFDGGEHSGGTRKHRKHRDRRTNYSH